MGMVMRQLLRQHINSVAVMCLSMFVVVLSATCIAGAEMPAAQQACCAGMTGGCGAAMAQDHGCCRATSPRLDQQLAAAPRLTLEPPVVIAIAHLQAVLQGTNVPESSTSPHPSDLSPPRTAPTHLTLSVFRV